MSGNDHKAVIYAALGVAVLTALALAVHTVPWLRVHRVEISLTLLALILLASGFTVAAAVLFDLNHTSKTRDVESHDPDTEVPAGRTEAAFGEQR